jgi:Zn-dependent peptidase ImmA (M78 family)
MTCGAKTRAGTSCKRTDLYLFMLLGKCNTILHVLRRVYFRSTNRFPMATQVQAIVKPAILEWARTTAGFTLADAAHRLGVKAEKLKAVEAGEKRLTFGQLKKAADTYKRPLAVFFLPEPPSSKPPLHDFRLQPGVSQRPYSPRLNYEIRNAQERRQEALELAGDLNELFPTFEFSASLEKTPETIANRVRNWLDVSLTEQKRWRDSAKALKAWKAAMERQGVLIFEVSRIPREEMRGFSMPADILPVIVLNGGDSHNGRIFTLFHEYTHLLLRQGGVCDMESDENPQNTDSQVEAFCNAVAGATLLPDSAIIAIAPDPQPREWTQEELNNIAKGFSVSKEVVLRRLLTLGRTTREHYQRMRRLFLAEYKQSAEERSSGDGGPSPSVMVVRNLGKPYISLVLEAYHQDRISLARVSDYLGVKVRHIERIGQLLARPESL